MKAVLLHRSYYPNIGGIETSLYCISRELFRRNIETTIVTQQIRDEPLNDRSPYANLLKFKKYKTPRVFLPISPLLYYKRSYRQLKRMLLEAAPDMIIARDSLLAKAALKILPKTPLVYIPPVVIRNYNKGVRPAEGLFMYAKEILRYLQLRIEASIQKEVMRKCGLLVVFSRNVMAQTEAILKDKTRDIIVAYPGVDNEKFAFFPLPGKEIHEEFNIPKDRRLLLYVGRVVLEKNIRMLVKAFAGLGHRDLHLVIVGSGDDIEGVRRLSHSLNVSEYVTFAGYRRDTERFYRCASITILPSYYEALGQVIVESLSSGTPVIGFRSHPPKVLTAVGELVLHKETGFICEEYGEESLADAIQRASEFCRNDNEDYKKMRNKCRESAAERFCWGTFTDTILKGIRIEKRDEQQSFMFGEV